MRAYDSSANGPVWTGPPVYLPELVEEPAEPYVYSTGDAYAAGWKAATKAWNLTLSSLVWEAYARGYADGVKDTTDSYRAGVEALLGEAA